MRIVQTQEAKASIASDIRNAYIDFSAMDVSVVKITTDVLRDGAPVVGYGFNSNGRYSQSGILIGACAISNASGSTETDGSP